MKRIAVVLGLWTLLLPMLMWANVIKLADEYGSATLSDAGITVTRSELTGFGLNWRHAPPGHDLGSLSFSTGALISGSIMGGGLFSSTGSTFDVIGLGRYGVPQGTIFTGSFFGPIVWTLVSQTGNNYVFDLTGNLSGTTYTGRMVTGVTVQTIDVNQYQRGRIHGGNTLLGSTAIMWPEPPTLALFATGLIVIVGITRRKLFGA